MMILTAGQRRTRLFHILALLLITNVDKVCGDQDVGKLQVELPTVTVRGFLNFKTTVDGTVIVFTPASEVPQRLSTTMEVERAFEEQPSKKDINNNDLASRDAVPVDIQDVAFTQPPSLPDPIQPEVTEFVHLNGPKIKESYHHHHISDNAVLPATVQTNNDLETDAVKKMSPSQNHYPTGLVTVLGGTNIENHKTTIYETKVIGTYIDGKYAQILQSTSQIIVPSSSESTTQTANDITMPSPVVEDTTMSTRTMSEVYDTSRSALNKPNLSTEDTSTASSITLTNELRNTGEERSRTFTGRTSSTETSSPAISLQSSFQMTETSSKPNLDVPTQSLENAKSEYSSSSQSLPAIDIYSTIRSSDDDEASLSSRNLRVSSSRIRFTAPKRPSRTVKLNRFKVKLTLRHNSTDGEMTTPSDEEEQEEENPMKEMEEPTHMIEETMDMDMDPGLVVYQQTTITSEVTLHVGRRKSIRTLTITTSVPMKINPTEAQTAGVTQDLMEADHDVEENVPATHSVVSRTFTTTERSFTTTLVPIFDGTSTTHHMMTESFFIMKIVTAYKTLPPGDVTILATSTEETDTPQSLAATLEVAANAQTPIMETTENDQITQTPATQLELQSSSSEPSVNIKPPITDPLMSLGQALSNNPLAAVYLGLHQLNAQMTLYSTITQTSTYVTTDTIYSTKTIRFYDGRSTKYRTTSEPISSKKRTVTTTITTVQPYINTQAYQQQQQLQKLIAATRLAAPQPQYSTITSIYTTATTATSLSTRIYTLIYNGFSTKFRTVTSTKTYPTTITVTSTTEVPIITQPPLLPFPYPVP